MKPELLFVPSTTETKPKLLYVLSHPMSADRLLYGQLSFMRERGFDVVFCASPDPALQRIADREGVRTIPLAMERRIHPMRDLRALLELIRLMRSLQPDVVNAGTTKAGLLGMVAARVTGVPTKVYVLRGLRLETAGRLATVILAGTEFVAAACANVVVCNSHSLRERFVSMHLAPRYKTRVLAEGSGNGVHAKRFVVDPARRAEAHRLSAELGLPEEATVLGFAGRLASDKSVDRLVEIFTELQRERPDLHLLLVGAPDPDDPLPSAAGRAISEHPAIHTTGHVEDPAPYYALMDLLVFMSRREGFPNVPIEAACAEVPLVGYAATGTVDAVVDGETGWLVPVGDEAALRGKLREALSSAEERARRGSAAKARALASFRPERVWSALEDVYREGLGTSTRVDGPAKPTRSVLLSVDLEDWAQLIGRTMGNRGWDRPSAAFERQVDTLLGLLDEVDARATFFVLGVSAKNYPGVLARIRRAGHELASHGYAHHPVSTSTPEEFRDDLVRSMEVLDSATGEVPRGYRAPAFSLSRRCVWALETLADLGFEYDSSQHDTPRVRERIVPPTPRAFEMLLPSGRSLWEVPPATLSVMGRRVPIGGGSYWRLWPSRWVELGVARFHAAHDAPAALYVHPYEFDAEPLSLQDASGKRVKSWATSLRYNVRRSAIPNTLRRLAARHNITTYEEYIGKLSQGNGAAALSPAGRYV